MGCKPKKPKCLRTYRDKKSVIRVVEELEIPSKNLREKGRIQYFYHSPLSELPVRDVSNEQGEGHKSEPHIEIGVENYLLLCRQANIIAHLNSNENYLFLVTTCKNEDTNEYGVPYLVGYMLKEKRLLLKDEDEYEWKATKGKTFIFPFNKSIPYYKIFDRFTPLRLVNEKKTKKILEHFKGKHNILQDCVKEIICLDEKNKKSDKTCIILKRGNCEYQNECLRWM